MRSSQPEPPEMTCSDAVARSIRSPCAVQFRQPDDHRFRPRPHPDHAPSAAHAPSPRDVQLEQETQRGVLDVREIGSDGGLQEAVGRMCWGLQDGGGAGRAVEGMNTGRRRRAPVGGEDDIEHQEEVAVQAFRFRRVGLTRRLVAWLLLLAPLYSPLRVDILVGALSSSHAL